MEKRQHTRIAIPLLVELKHPALGTIQTRAKDVSQGGIFVYLDQPALTVGSKLKLQLLTTMPADTQATPTVEVQVVRVSAQGMGLVFASPTAKHLWQSVQRLRQELEIGKDFFQVHHSIALTHAERGIFLVKHNGKWLFPGHYLIVGGNAVQETNDFLAHEFNLSPLPTLQPSAVECSAPDSVAEAAVYSVTFSALVDSVDVKLGNDSAYTDWRWVNKNRDLNAIVFASENQRSQSRALLNELKLD